MRTDATALARERITVAERLIQLGILTVDIPEEPHLAVRFDYGRNINNEHWDGLCEIYLDRLIAVHGGENLVLSPFRPVAQDPRREPRRILYPDASVAEVAARL